VYSLGVNSDAFPTDLQFYQKASSTPIGQNNQNWTWKGEWWMFGGTMIYSHTITPNRAAFAYGDVGQDGRGSVTMINASSFHSGGVNCLLADGSVRFIKTSVNPQSWYALATPNGGEVLSADSY